MCKNTNKKMFKKNLGYIINLLSTMTILLTGVSTIKEMVSEIKTLDKVMGKLKRKYN